MNDFARLRMRQLASLCAIVTGLTIGAHGRVLAADDTPMPVDTPDPNAFTTAATVRQIPRAHLYVTGARMSESGGYAGFINLSPRSAKRVVMFFSGSAGSDDASSSTIAAKGHFSTGATIYARWGSGDYRLGTPDKYQAYVATPIEVDYEDGTVWHSGPDVIGETRGQSPGLTVVRTYAWQAGGECVDFTVGGTRPIAHVGFVFSHIDSDGQNVGDDPFDLYATYAPGQVVAMTCRTRWSGTVTPGIGSGPGSPDAGIMFRGKHVALVSSVSRIDYVDGTSWVAIPSQAIVATFPTASVPRVTYDSWWPSSESYPIRFARDPASKVDITGASASLAAASDECVDYTTNSAVPVAFLRFTFTNVGVDGKILGSAVVDDRARRPYIAGSYHTSCFVSSPDRRYGSLPVLVGWPGSLPGGNTFAIAGFSLVLPVQWDGGELPLQGFYDGLPLSEVRVTMDEVKYADGTSWHPVGASP